MTSTPKNNSSESGDQNAICAATGPAFNSRGMSMAMPGAEMASSYFQMNFIPFPARSRSVGELTGKFTSVKSVVSVSWKSRMRLASAKA